MKHEGGKFSVRIASNWFRSLMIGAGDFDRLTPDFQR
jgi:hypothetical protein